MKHTTLLLVLYLGWVTHASAEAPLESLNAADILSSQIDPLPSTALGDALSDTDLADQRGKANTTITNTNDVDGELYNNNATNTVSGGNFVSDSSLSNNTGLFTVIQNSGNNVLIQSATILNLDIQQ